MQTKGVETPEPQLEIRLEALMPRVTRLFTDFTRLCIVQVGLAAVLGDVRAAGLGASEIVATAGVSSSRFKSPDARRRIAGGSRRLPRKIPRARRCWIVFLVGVPGERR